MPLSIQFRWKTPQVPEVRNRWDRAGMSEGLDKIASTILAVKDRRYRKEQDDYNRAQQERRNAIEDEDRRYRKEQDEYNKEQQERRNAIEDEDRSRRMAEEDRRRKAYGEAADYMRIRSAERDALVKRAEQIKAEIAALKAQLGE